MSIFGGLSNTCYSELTMELREEKAQLRTQMRAARAALGDDERTTAQEILTKRLLSLPAVKHAKTIGVYKAYGSEASLDDCIAALRKLDDSPKIAYPLVISSSAMVFTRVDVDDDLEIFADPRKVITEYDQSKIYMQTLLWDKGDGTLGTWHRFFTDAACTDEITGYAAWVDEDGHPVADQSATSDWEAVTQSENVAGYSFDIPTYNDGSRTYTQVNAAYFFNSRTVEIPVKKVWDGMPVESVTLHLQRALVAADKPLDEIDDTYVATFKEPGAQGVSNYETWRAVGYVTTLDRAEFLKADGTPDYDVDGTGETLTTVTRTYAGATAIDGFNKDLPMFVMGDGKIGDQGVLYRAVYRLMEDDTSDTYTPSYKRENGTTGGNYFVDKGTLVVTNTTTATNVARITAAKQLMDRDWNDQDFFRFFLTRLGKGTYYTEAEAAEYNTDYNLSEGDTGYKRAGDLKTDADGKAVLDQTNLEANVPLPTAHVGIDPYPSGAPALDAHCAASTITTPALGEGEHLARFGSITYTTSMLELNPTGRHLQGDYYYQMTEYVPDTAIAVRRTLSSGQTMRDVVLFTVDETAGTATEDTTGSQLTYGVAKNLANFDLGDYYWKIPEGTTGTDGYDGILYDGTVHIVHVQVRENRTQELQVVVAYDETDQSKTSTGSQFTPVFTNHYEATATAAPKVQKQKLGGDWTADNTYDFTIQPLSGAPFEDADHAGEFVQGDTVDGAKESSVRDQAEATDGHGWAAHTSEGKHLIRMKVQEVTEAERDGTTVITRTFPKLKFTLDELTQRVGSTNEYLDSNAAVKYSNGDRVPEGIRYGRFFYLVEETACSDETVIKDEGREYVRITAIDKQDGTIDTVVEYFDDLDATTKHAGVEGAPFTNLATTTVTVKKTWDGIPDEDVTVHLERQTTPDGGEAGAWESLVTATDNTYAHTFQMSDFATSSTATYTFHNLPTRAVGANDEYVNYAYRVVEAPPVRAGNFTTTYPHQTTIGNDDDGNAWGSEEAPLEVKNTAAKHVQGTARIILRKEVHGRTFGQAETPYTFVVEPYGAYEYDENFSVKKKEADGAPKVDETVKDVMPLMGTVSTSDTNFAEKNGDYQYIIRCPELTFGDKLLIHDTVNGTWKRDLVYRIREQMPSEVADAANADDDPTNNWTITGSGDDKSYTDPDGYAITFNTDGSETYKGITYNATTFYAHVSLSTSGYGESARLDTSVEYLQKDLKTPTTTVYPYFNNYYTSSGIVNSWIIKDIEGREWQDFSLGENGSASGDAFQFTITSVGGSVMHSSVDSGAGVYPTPVLTKNAIDETGINTGIEMDVADLGGSGKNYDVAMRTGANPHTGGQNGDLGSDGDAYFIYAVQEKPAASGFTYDEETGTSLDETKLQDYAVDDLVYDPNIVYMRIHAWDNWDGTISYEAQYFTDAACHNEIVGHTLWIDNANNKIEKDTTKTENAAQKLAALNALTSNDEGYAEALAAYRAAGYTQVNAAYFTNTRNVDIDVQKTWEGTPVEDVTVRIYRALFPLAEETYLDGESSGEGDTQQYGDDYVKSKGDSIWRLAGLGTTMQRGDFINADGTVTGGTTYEIGRAHV